MKVLILSCGTGGGHNSAALALQENLRSKDVQADFLEYLSIINPKIKNKVNKLYLNSTKRNGRAFKVVYHLGEIYQKTKIKSPVYLLNKLSKQKLYQYIKENGYDYIVTTHLFAAEALTCIKKEHDPGGRGHGFVKSYFVDMAPYNTEYKTSVFSRVLGRERVRTRLYK